MKIKFNNKNKEMTKNRLIFNKNNNEYQIRLLMIEFNKKTKNLKFYWQMTIGKIYKL